MLHKCALLGCVGILLLPVALRAAPRPPTDDAERVSHVTIAVTDFPGEDRALGHFLSDTLLTDLGHSDRLQTLEPNELQQALADLDMRDSGPMTPGQVRHLGDLIHASRIVVGSFMVRDDQVVINARLLDTQSGLIVPGSAINVAGSRKSLLGITHKLARQLCRRLTGEDLFLEDEGDGRLLPQEREVRPQEPAPFLPEEVDPLEPYKRTGLIPSSAHPNSPLVERDLTGFIGRLAKRITPQTDNAIHLGQTLAPVTRLQALAALVKMIISAGDIATFRNTPASSLTPDGAQVPLWGQPYLAAALDQRWWDAGSPFRSRETATWGFIQTLLDRVLEREAPRPSVRRSEPPAVNESFTGLVIDARDFDLQRDHSPCIVDEDGNKVYPDPKHVPSPDYVDANGVASYGLEESDARRSGSHPLIIRALGVSGPGPFDVVVSNEDARRIVDANRRSKFLWKWNVTLLVR